MIKYRLKKLDTQGSWSLRWRVWPLYWHLNSREFNKISFKIHEKIYKEENLEFREAYEKERVFETLARKT